MELVGELPASHHLASRPARVVGDVGMYGEGGGVGWRGAPLMRLRRDSGQTPHHPNISPHISHATQAEKRASPSLHHLSFFPSLSCSVLAHPWATVPSSHTPAGRTWCPASSIIPRVDRFNCSLHGGSGIVLRRGYENLMTAVLFSIWRNHVRSKYVIMDRKQCDISPKLDDSVKSKNTFSKF